MKTVKRSKWRVPTSTNCKGRATKKARIRLRWSLRRVCARVMNSRSARNERMPKVMVAPTGPEIQASQKTVAPSHSARSSRVSC